MKKKKFFKTKMQIFAGTAWLLMTVLHTLNFLDSTVGLEHYLLGVAIITGTCLLAWGMPFAPISHYLATGTQIKPFKVGKSTKDGVDRSKEA